MFNRVRFAAKAGGALVIGVATGVPLVQVAWAQKSERNHFKVLVVGGGTGGTSVANQINRRGVVKGEDIAIIEPSKHHYYQSSWSMVGGGIFKKEDSQRETKDFIPTRSTWVHDSVKSFQPEHNEITLQSGRTIKYETLVVAAGIKMDYNKIPGLLEALEDPKVPVTTIYDYKYAEKVNQVMSKLERGNVIFTVPSGSIKCGGAPQKIMWLWEANWNALGVRPAIHISFCTPQAAMFQVPKYTPALDRMAIERGINTSFGSELVSLSSAERRATFRNVKSGELVERDFDALHVVPPMSPPDAIKQSPLANPNGYISVDPATLQHTRYPNVFALGDSADLPTSKTASAVSAQAPVVVHNLHQHLAGRPLTAKYDGYTACPILLGNGKLLLAEFKYGQQPAETFGSFFDQIHPSRLGYVLKRYAFPEIYWRFFVTGLWYGPRTFFPPTFPAEVPETAKTPVAAKTA